MKKFFILMLLTVHSVSAWCYIPDYIVDENDIQYYVISKNDETKTGTVSIYDGGRVLWLNWEIVHRDVAGDIVIPATISYIEDDDFGHESTTWTFSVIRIDDYAFEGNAYITSIILPNTIESIGVECFKGCDKLTSVILNEGLKSISVGAFSYSGITTLTIPASVDNIKGYICDHCQNLGSLVVSSANPKYDSRNNCFAIIETATNTMKNACDNTYIPEGIFKIDYKAFYGCQLLTSLHIPASVRDIDQSAFCDCYTLTNITVDENNPVYDSRNNCNAIIVSANDSLIVGCASTVIPEDVKTIGVAFNGCPALTSISIPREVKRICQGINSYSDDLYGNRIYYGNFNCRNLRKVVMNSNTPPFVSYGAFSAVSMYDNESKLVALSYSNAVYDEGALYVPRGTTKKYRAVEGWNRFNNIIEKDLEPILNSGKIDYSEYIISIDDLGYIEDPEERQQLIDELEAMEYNYYVTSFNDVIHYNGKLLNRDGSITINKSLDESKIEAFVGLSMDNDMWVSDYNGMVFKLKGGNGSLVLMAETLGNRTLNVKIGDQEPIIKELGFKQRVEVPYHSNTEAYVYIYADKLSQSGAKGMKQEESGENQVKIYSIEWEFNDSPTGVERIEELSPKSKNVVGGFLLDGRKTLSESRGISIVRSSDGSYRKVVKK